MRLTLAAALLTGCAGITHPPTPAGLPATSPAALRAVIDASLPRVLTDRSGWLDDIYAAFTVLTIKPSHENVCAVVAVIQQESGFRVDPEIPGLGVMATREIETRAAHAHVPLVVVHGVLDLNASGGGTYAERIKRARTEKELSDIYEDLIDRVPLGRTLLDDNNPIRTRGPMQVSVTFAERFASAAPYPYPVARRIPDELFTRRGSIYFGIAHLLDYRAPYDAYLFRFADYNAGQYASRNAAFQHAITLASGIKLDSDGTLLRAGNADTPGATELAARALAAPLRLSQAAIHRALEQAKLEDFERTSLYERVFELARLATGMPVPRAVVPTINLQGPKIKRRLTTAWYAERVDERYRRCLKSQASP